MKWKKALCSLLAAAQLTTLCGNFPAAQTEPETDGLRPKMADSMPVIDGDLGDSVWNPVHAIAEPVAGSPAHTAKFDMVWDYTYLYIGVQIENDAELIPGSSWMNGDIVSLFFDPAQHKSAPYAQGDWQIGIGYNPDDNFNPTILFGAGVTASEAECAALRQGVLAATQKTETGWNAELALPWDALGIDPYLQQQFGFDISADNKLSSHPKDALDSLMWQTNGSQSFWNDTSGFGTVSLSGEVLHNTDSKVLYEENFDNIPDGALPDGFVPAAGQQAGWSVQDGRLVADFSKAGETERRILLPALGDNFIFEADVTFEDAVNTGRWVSAFYRAPLSGGFGYYHFTNRLNGAGEISLKGADNTWPTAFVNTNGTASASPLAKDKPYHLSVEAFGQNLSHKRTGTEDAETFDHSVTAYDKLGASRPATLESDLKTSGRFGLQADQCKAAFDNLKITKLELTGLAVTGLPESVQQLDTIAAPEIRADYSNGKTGVAVHWKDAKLYSSNQDVLRPLEDGGFKALREGVSTVAVIVGNQLFEQEVTVTKGDREPAITSLTVQNKMDIYPVLPGQSVSTSYISFDAVDEAFEERVIDGSYQGMTFTSSDESVAKVEDGVFHAVSKGFAVITASVGNASDSLNIWVRGDEDDKAFISEGFENGMPASWKSLGGSYSVREENGNHFLEMGPNTRLLIPIPEGVDNYTIEADVTFMSASNAARWASIMVRVQNEDYPYYQFAIRQDATAANGVEFAAMNAAGAWDVRETASAKQPMELGTTHHMKLTITGDRVKQWLDGNELIFTDKAGDLSGGCIGLQSNLVTVRFDNLKVDVLPEELPDVTKPEANFAQNKVLHENLVNAPTVIAGGVDSLAAMAALISDDVTSQVMLDVRLEDGVLTAYSGGARVGTLAEAKDALYGKILLLLQIEDIETANALAAYIEDFRLEDLQVASADTGVLKAFRDQAPATRGSLALTEDSVSLEDAYRAVGDANTAKAKNIILRQSAATRSIVEALQQRLMTVWVVSDDSASGLYAAVSAGANGIITAKPGTLKQLASIYTNRTLTRRSFIIGHRGTPGNAPENTMAGFIKAHAEYGAQMFENDVYLTKDKEVILLHDDTFARTTDILTNQKLPDSLFTNGLTRQNCRPKDLTLEQVKLLDAGSYYGPEFAGEQVPTLKEHLEYMRGKPDIVMFLELKDTSEGIEKACTDLIRAYGLEDQVCAITFNAKSVPLAQQELPTMSVGYLPGVGAVDSTNPLITIRKVLNQTLPINTTYNPSYSSMHNEAFISAANARGLSLWPWTYRSKDAFAWAIDHGVSGLTTDYANWAKDYVFDLRAEQDAYTLSSGETLALGANGITNLGDKIPYAPEVVVIEGGDVIRAEGGSVTALKAGTATVMLRASTRMDQAVYDLYTEPVTITVGNAFTITGAPESGYTRGSVTLQAGRGVTWTVNGTLEDRISSTLRLQEEGSYTVTATDANGAQSAPVTFTIDRTAPTLRATCAHYGFTNQDVVFTAGETVSFYNGGEKLSEGETLTLTENGTYNIRAIDQAGNYTDFYRVTILKDKPVLTGLPEKNITNRSVSLRSDRKVRFTVNRVQSDDYAYALRLTEPGGYTIEATDLAGNTTRVSITIDRTKPTFTATVPSGVATNQDIRLGASEVCHFKVDGKIVQIGTQYFPKNGEVVRVYDLAGNYGGAYRANIDKTAPVLTAVIEGTNLPVENGATAGQSVAVRSDKPARFIVNGGEPTDRANFVKLKADGVFTVQAVDLLGNVSETITITIQK